MIGRAPAALLVVVLVAGCAGFTARATARASPTPADGRGDDASLASPSFAVPTPTSTPTPATGPSRLVEHGDRGSREVALTFTIGYRLEPAVGILELLRERGVTATIFMSGIAFDQDGTRAAAERVLLIQSQAAQPPCLRCSPPSPASMPVRL